MMSQEENSEVENKNIRKIVYIGNDVTYFKNLQEKFEFTYPNEKFSFKTLFEEDEKKIDILLHAICLIPSDLIFIDYSLNSESMLLLARNLKREALKKKSAIIGLIDNLESKKNLLFSISFGISTNMIKGADTTSVIHHAMTLAFPDIAVDTDFALTKKKVESNSKAIFRLAYVSDKKIGIESNYSFEKGEPVRIISKLKLTSDLSHFYLVSSRTDSNLYSNNSQAYDLSIDHMDTTEIDRLAKIIEDIEAQLKEDPKDFNLKYEFDERSAEFDAALEKSDDDARERPIALAKWIEAGQKLSKPKRTRILMIDPDMDCLYDSRTNFDDLPYSIQMHTEVDKEDDVIHRVRPGIIAIKLENSDGSDLELLSFLTSLIKKQEDYSPIVLVFNYAMDLDELKKLVDYDSIIASHDKINMEFITKCYEIYSEKQGRSTTHGLDNDDKDKDERVFLGKYDPKSILYYDIPIEITSLSETDIIFNSEVDIPFYSSIYIKIPSKMTITVVPFKKNSSRVSEVGKYYGLINGIGEVQLAALRKYVNDLIFEENNKDE